MEMTGWDWLILGLIDGFVLGTAIDWRAIWWRLTEKED